MKEKIKSRSLFTSLLIDILMGALLFFILHNLYTAIIFALLISPLSYFLLKEGYEETLKERELIEYMKSLEELLMHLSNEMRLGITPENAIIKVTNRMSNENLFNKPLKKIKELIVRGIPAHKAVIKLKSSTTLPTISVFIDEVAKLLSFRGESTSQSLLTMASILRKHRRLLEDYEVKLKAQKIKVRILSIINSASLGLLACMIKNFGFIISGFPWKGISISLDDKELVYSISPAHGNVIILTYLLFALLSSYYASCIIRDPEPQKGIFLSIVSFTLTLLLLSLLFT